MTKKPKSSEVLMFGQSASNEPKLARAEIITRGPDGKMRVEQGGVVAQPAQPVPRAAADPGKAAPSPQPGADAPQAQSRAIAETVVGGFVDRLRSVAERRGGYLSVTDLDGMQAEFQAQAVQLQKVFEQSFEAYVQARERASWNQARNYPFDRVLVKRFSHLFNLKSVPGMVSRRMLPGFFLAVSMMLGPDAVEAYQGRARIIVDRIRGGRDGFDWDEVYAAPEIRRLVTDAQIAMLPYFKDYDRRSAWFINLVNGNLAPPPDEAPPSEANWEFTESGFRRFLGAFFKELRDTVTSPEARRRFTEQYGQQTVDDIILVLKQIDGFA